ncbi:MAG: type II secretion system secretin GspD [Thermodesulfobacteriota bacterium]
MNRNPSKMLVRWGLLLAPIVVALLIGWSPLQSEGASRKAVETKAPVVRTPSDAAISIDFNNVDIAVFVKFISELTGRNFVMDQRVTGKITVISPEKISVAEAYRVFESVLEVYGYTTVPSGNVTKIIPMTDARTKSIETRLLEESGSTTDRVVTQILPLQYADATLVSRLFSSLISKNSVMIPYPATNTLIVTDVESNIQRLAKMLKTIDIPMTGRELQVFTLQYANAAQIVKLLDTMFQTGQRQPVAEGVIGMDAVIRAAADERTNSLIVLASEDYMKRVRELVRSLDKESARVNERMRVYYLENARAEDIAKVLQDIPSRKTDAAGGEADRSAKPTILSSRVRITADKATNSLIITADKDEYAVLEDIIRQLDIPRAMVYIECLIMEVNVNKDFNLGTEWVALGEATIGGRSSAFGGGFSGAGKYPDFSNIVSSTTGVATPPSGFSVGVFSELLEIGGIKFPGLQAIVKAYRKDKDVNILSTPQILTTDNEEAVITVGKNVPYQTKSGTTGTFESFNTYEYRDVGITLKITPQISKDRMVRLTINQEVTKLDLNPESTTVVNAERPTTLKRTISTTVLVKDEHTVVIGGLIDDSFSETRYKTPCLGDVPLAGWLFKSISKGREKTNLFVFLTPRVVKSPPESDRIYEKKKSQMDDIQEKNATQPSFMEIP